MSDEMGATPFPICPCCKRMMLDKIDEDKVTYWVCKCGHQEEE